MTEQNPVPDVQAQLVTVLRSLKPSATDEELNRHAACLRMTHMFAAIGDLPRAQNKGFATAKHEVSCIQKKTIELAAEIEALHSEALRAFEHVEPRGELHPLMLKRTLIQFARAAGLAYKQLPDGPSRKGAPPVTHKRQVAKHVIKVYKELTGRRAGRSTSADKEQPSGPLQTFLTKVYAVFGIDGSADAQLKTILSSTHGINASKKEH